LISFQDEVNCLDQEAFQRIPTLQLISSWKEIALLCFTEMANL